MCIHFRGHDFPKNDLRITKKLLSFKEANICYVFVVIKRKNRNNQSDTLRAPLFLMISFFRTMSGDDGMFAKASHTLKDRAVGTQRREQLCPGNTNTWERRNGSGITGCGGGCGSCGGVFRDWSCNWYFDLACCRGWHPILGCKPADPWPRTTAMNNQLQLLSQISWLQQRIVMFIGSVCFLSNIKECIISFYGHVISPRLVFLLDYE